jgi:hypothetical protein
MDEVELGGGNPKTPESRAGASQNNLRLACSSLGKKEEFKELIKM